MRAGSLKPPVLSTTWEQKMAAKAERAAFTSARTSAVEARKAKKRVGGALGWGVAGDRGEGVGRSGQEWAGVGRSGQEWADCLPCAGRCHNPAPPATNTSPTPFYPHLVSLQAAREKREAARARKEANTARSAVVQTITKASTLQRMLKSKKARKSLRKADTVQVS